MGNDANGGAFGSVGREFEGFLVHLDVRGPELEGAPHAGGKTDNHDAQDEEGRNLQAVGGARSS